MSPRRHALALRLGVLLGAAAALVACGISGEERVTHIPVEDLGALANTTTTSTTTTTVAPQPTSAPVSQPPATTTTTTTIEIVPTKFVDVFYVPRGRDDVVRRQPLRQALTVTLEDMISLLSDPPEDVLAVNLVSEVTPELIASARMDRLWTEVDLNSEAFDAMSDADRRQAIAQIVLTLTSFITPDRGAVNPIVFSLDGEPLAVPYPGGLANPGEPVAFQDFWPWIETEAAVATTPSTAPSPPTEPATPPTSAATTPNTATPA